LGYYAFNIVVEIYCYTRYQHGYTAIHIIDKTKKSDIKHMAFIFASCEGNYNKK